MPPCRNANGSSTGTIDGVLLITNTSLAIFDFNVDELEVGHATSFSGYIPFSPLAQITSQERLTSIAEPATAAVVLTGLLGLAFGARRRRTAG